MTPPAGERVIRFAQSIHMRRSTAALIVFLLATVAAYLVARPIPTHVAQARAVASTTTATDEGTTTTTTTTTRTITRATASPTTAAPTPDPSATPTPTVAPTPTDLTPSPSTDGGLFGSVGASPTATAGTGSFSSSGVVAPGFTTSTP
ncbi:hypothetical protein MXD59_13995 [Frankia sp. Ag45/Mut15]|uniref:Uncharacterized protein n=1 Tax=Frankia umida TaxID=573489 RepID=A0ABT0JZZ7_9ACTN|nr:hypothetical protein [Frankia umida]MCK9876879.1 hypothetical protein [Frankia umida]